MEFEDEDREEEQEEEEEEDEEDITIPPPTQTQTYDTSTPPFPAANHHLTQTKGGGPTVPATFTATATRYRECLKNHAVSIGGHAVDGCGEFMPAGADGTLDALKCAACGCHRNFHRKESNVSNSSPAAANPLLYPQITPSPYYCTPPPPPFQVAPHPTSAAAASGHHHHHYHWPLALPSTSGGYGRGDHEMDEFSNLTSSSGGGGGGGGGGGSTAAGVKSKRFRTTFTAEQKDRMLEFSEKVGWRIQKHDEAAVQQFCQELGVKRQVLKVWMHNNKNTLGRKP